MNPTELAEAQAAKDAEIMAFLREKAASGGFTVEDGDESDSIFADAAEATVPYTMNRAERRAAVEQFKRNLRDMPKRRPVRNPTVRARKH